MFRSGSARLARATAMLVLIVAGCGGSAIAPPSAGPTEIASSSSTTEAPPTSTPAAAAPSTGPTVYDTTLSPTTFDLPMTIQLPAAWIPLEAPMYGAPKTIGFVEDSGGGDESKWWGFGFELVDGASVVDPAQINEAAVSGDAKQPWPASYVDYLASVPGVVVEEGPDMVKVGGIDGRRVVVTTPPMHPTIYIKGDTAWLGGGRTGIDPAFKREIIEFAVDGRNVLFEYVDLPERFDGHVGQVDAILGTVEFGP